MVIQNYKKFIFYLKTAGTSVVVISGCWFLYQLRQTKLLVNSVIPPRVLELENVRAQYIYIDDPRYKDIFMFNHVNNLNPALQDEPSTLNYKFTKWWKSLNHDLALRFFQLAHDEDKTERRRALDSLVSLTYLKDWHYCQIAQMMDARTAVSLARSPKADLRFFMKPPQFQQQQKLNEVIEELYNLLTKLNALCSGRHLCLLQFLHKKFQGPYQDNSMFEHDLSSVGLPVSPPVAWDQAFFINCVHAIHHHSSLEEHSRDLADAGALQVLLNVYKHLGDNVDICILIAKIISNLSSHPEYLNDIFQSGWIGILAAWSRHQDIRLASPASRALINLDPDDSDDERYFQRIYPLYPLHRVNFKKKLDLVFIHGLLGGVFVTWRQRDVDRSVPLPDDPISTTRPDMSPSKHLSLRSIVDDHPSEFLRDLAKDLENREWQRVGNDFEVVLDDCPVNMKSEDPGPFFCSGDDECIQETSQSCGSRTQCWPKDWIPKDVPNVRVIGINYTSNLSMWTPLCPIEGVRSTIKERSNEFTQKLVVAGVGKRPIIWACHSMGGLLVKKMLVEEWKNGDANNILRNTKGIVFYSTPHRGSHIASLNQTTQMLIWPSIEVQELREESPQLLQLHDDFLKMLKEHDIEIISFTETKPTRCTALKVPITIVNSNSADPGVGEFYEIPQDHLTICKPASRQSFLYQKVLAMIKRHSQISNDDKYHWENLVTFFEKVM
ncbi:hypothetical protein QAD02_016310 [Eretmocerus hayati]|uniref:Uncharacterized protein n=1 Tax=Eretmocerus hayati TaxID=131215 RepID=A0ACC2PBQ3_9HYME|nr:hypothetical protein QAD02_016310 [Eretmocerus hayati]